MGCGDDFYFPGWLNPDVVKLNLRPFYFTGACKSASSMAPRTDPDNPFFGTFYVVGLDTLSGVLWRPSPSFRPGSRSWRFVPDDRWADREGNTVYTGSVFNYAGCGPDEEFPFCYDSGSRLLAIDIVSETGDCPEDTATFVFEVGTTAGDVVLTGIAEDWPYGQCFRWRLRKM